MYIDYVDELSSREFSLYLAEPSFNEKSMSRANVMTLQQEFFDKMDTRQLYCMHGFTTVYTNHTFDSCRTQSTKG